MLHIIKTLPSHLSQLTVSHGFQVAAAITTASSMEGTYHGIAPLMSSSQAALCAASLGIVSFATMNYAWNHKGFARRSGAALIAAAALSTSIWTIDLAAQDNLRATAQASNSANQSTLHAEQITLDNKDNKIKAELKVQLDRFAEADKADRADAALLRTDVRQQVRELQKANAADQAQIAAYQALIKKHQRPKTNGANVRATQRKVDKRITQIGVLNGEIKSLSDDLDQKLATRAIKASKLSEKLSTPAPIAATKTAIASSENPQQRNTIIHSSIRDLCSFFFLLLSALYRKETPVEDDEVTPDISSETLDTSPVSTLENERLVEAYPTVDHFLPDTSLIFNQPETAEEIKPVTLNKVETLEQLRNHQIAANSQGRITNTLIREVTGWGYSKANTFLKNDCTEAGVLDAHEDGSGSYFTYPQAKAAPVAMLSVVNGGKS